jgi:hypothetical protein
MLCYGIAIGILGFAGLRALAAFMENLLSSTGVVMALLSAGASMLLLPLSIGLLLRIRFSMILTKVYLWVFVISNVILIPLYIIGKLDPGLNLAATCATWVGFIIALFLLHFAKPIGLNYERNDES